MTNLDLICVLQYWNLQRRGGMKYTWAGIHAGVLHRELLRVMLLRECWSMLAHHASNSLTGIKGASLLNLGGSREIESNNALA
jgi:hypothetical protein